MSDSSLYLGLLELFSLLDIDLEVFFEAAEDWNSAMTISNSMAFISQFGEVSHKSILKANQLIIKIT